MSNELITIERLVLEQEQYYPGATGEFTRLLYDITFAAKIISSHVMRAGLVDILGSAGKENIHGEEVQKLDKFADRIIRQAMDHTGRLCIMASEEWDDPIAIPDQYPSGKYVLVFDPLDGSSNIESNASIGSVFSIHKKVSNTERGTLADILQKGTEQVAAVYVIYGSSTMLVYATQNGVNGFTLDPGVGEFLLSHPDIRVPEQGDIYSVNEGNYTYWESGIQKYIDYLKSRENHLKKPFSLRYIGSMVADLHRTLLYGGIFMYPPDSKDPKKPSGKLRLLYEASPMAFIFEKAGGLSSNGYQSILNVEPDDLHQRIPLYIGSANDVRLVEKYIQNNGR